MISRILLFNAHPRALITQLRELSKIEGVEIHLALHNKRINHKLFLFKYFKKIQVHYFSQNELIDFLLKLKDKIGSFTILQNGEEFLRIILESKILLQNNLIFCNFTELETYLKLSDKKSFSELCEKYDIKTPKNISIDLTGFSRKFVAKAKVITKEKEVLTYPMLVENEKSFHKFVNLNLDLDKHFFQEYILGQSFYYCADYDFGKRKICFIQENLKQQPNGKSVIKAKKGFLDEQIIQKIDKIFEDAKWNGVMMFELKKCSQTSNYYAIECNPRFWGPLQLASDNGVNFINSVLNIKNEKPEDAKNTGYIWLTGYFQGLLFKLKTKTNFQTFGNKNIDIKFKDLWFRSDTFIFFIFEPLFIFIDFISKLRNN